MRRILFNFWITCILVNIIIGCSKDDPKPATGKLVGKVTEITSETPLHNVSIIVFNADNNAPYGKTVTSDVDGNFSTDLPPGNYYIKLYKQGYNAVPSPGLEAVAFTIELSQQTDQSAEMTPINISGAGLISGKITSGSSPVAGVLIVAENGSGQTAYSSVSAEDGQYMIYNVPSGNYTVKGYVAGYQSNSVDISVSNNAETSQINLVATAAASGRLTGSIRNLAAGNKDVDVSLVHPITKETIPGLTTFSVNQTYTINNVPDGQYIARATFKNDERVMDPDRIAKFGEPTVSISGGSSIELTFDITGSIQLESPTNPSSTTKPLEVNSTKPTFSWVAYSSTSDYVIEVLDASTGVVIWGGFDRSGNLPIKNISIPSSQRSIVFNSDGSALVSQLTPGKIYRWRIFASKNDQNSSTGWTLISASEDQMGLIKVE